MKCTARYNPVKDLKEVDQFGFVDLVEATVNGVVESYVSDTEASYNGIEDPSTILGKPSDVFEAARMQDSIHASLASQETEKSNPS